MGLTAQEIERFHEVGYLPIRQRLLDDDHLSRLRERYDALFSAKRQTRGQGLRNIAVVGASESSEDADTSEEMLQIMEMWSFDDEYRNLLYHKPLLDVAESLIGPDIQLFHDQALYKPARNGGEVPWHQDNGYWRCDPPELVSIWIALDDADEQNGCMNMVPGSHRLGAVGHGRAQTDRGQLPALLSVDVDAAKAVPVPIKAGHGLVHHCQTLHQTNPNRSSRDRRAMVIHYMKAGTRNANGQVMAGNLLLRGKMPADVQ